jgi:hypothetical protein
MCVPFSADLLDVGFIDRQHRIATREAVQDFPHPILQMVPVLSFSGPAPYSGEAIGVHHQAL